MHLNYAMVLFEDNNFCLMFIKVEERKIHVYNFVISVGYAIDFKSKF